MTGPSSDYWLSPESHMKMPKREIGDYVESMGFRVPKRYEALEEVRKGGSIIILS